MAHPLLPYICVQQVYTYVYRRACATHMTSMTCGERLRAASGGGGAGGAG